MSETDAEEKIAIDLLDNALSDLVSPIQLPGAARREMQVQKVRDAIDALMHVRLAQFAELMADRVEEKLGARP